MSKTKGKGKAPALEENPPSPVFPLKLSKLQADYVDMMAAIEAKVKEINENEINKEPVLSRKPLRVVGRLYTPKEGTFMVKLEPDGEGKIVHLLFQWVDLYFVGFYVEGVWYYFDDFDKKMLPPQSQLAYNPKDGVGKIKLIFSTSYNKIGGYFIKVGRHAFNRCLVTLSKASELHDNTEGQKALKAGPLSLPMVAISEAIRFGLWRACVTGYIGEEMDTTVTDEYGDYFQFWSSISLGLTFNRPTLIRGITVPVEDMAKLVRIVLRNDGISTIFSTI